MPKQSQSESGTEILLEACQRNAAIELHHTDGTGELTVAKTRLLATDEEHLYVAQPQCLGGVVSFRAGNQLDAFLSYQENLYCFRSTVVNPIIPVALNERKRVQGMSLTLPTRLRAGQRRRCFRISLIRHDPIAVSLHTTSAATPEACPLDARRFTGTMIDLSVGGMGLGIDRCVYSTFNVGDLIFISFPLPSEVKPLEFLAQVRQSRPLTDDSNTRLGLQFEIWPTMADFRTRERLVQKFINDTQRAMTRRAA